MNLLRSLVKSDLQVFGLVFAAIFVPAFIYALWQPRLYQANAALQFYPRPPTLGIEDVSVQREDPIFIVGSMSSSQFLKRVVNRLTNEERTLFLKPYLPAQVNSEEGSVGALIRGNQTLVFKANILTILYRHPDRMVASRIANLYADEGIAYQTRLRIDEEMKQIEELVLRAKSQQQVVKDLTEELSAYCARRKKNTTDLIENDGPYQERLKRQVDGQKTLDALISRIRDTTMICGPAPTFCRVTQRAVPPNEDDYLIAPVVGRLSWGFAVAVFGGLLAVGVVNIFTRGRELADHQKEAA